MKIVDIFHNYEATVFLDHIDEHRAMRKAFNKTHEVIEAYFESLPQEETKLRNNSEESTKNEK